MKLYSADLSPFAARARLAVYAKGLSQVEIVGPLGGDTRSAEYLAVQPLGKVPSLATDDGQVIPESEIIVEYLEDKFPTPSLRPESAEDKAKARLLVRVVELYVMPGGGALFGQMNPATRDAKVVEESLAQVATGLAYLEHYLGDGPYAVGDRLTTADCALAPFLFFLGVFAQAFQRPDLISSHPKIAAYWAHIQTDPHAGRVLGEIGAALRARMGG